MVASGFRWRPTLWMALGGLFALAIPVALLAAYWGLDYFDWLPHAVPDGWRYRAEGKLLRDAGNGDTDESKEKLRAAIQRLSTAIKDNPDNVPAYYFRAVAHERLGDEKLALDDYADAIRHNKEVEGMSAAERKVRNAAPLELDLENAYFHCATLRDELSKPGDTGQLNEAVADFSAALDLHRDFAEAYFGRAAAYMKLGQPAQSVLDLNEAVLRAPDYREAISLRARAYLKTGNETLAMEDARRALPVRPDRARRLSGVWIGALVFAG